MYVICFDTFIHIRYFQQTVDLSLRLRNASHQQSLLPQQILLCRFQHLHFFHLFIPGNKILVAGQLCIQIIPDFLPFLLLLLRPAYFLVPFLHLEIVMDNAILQPFDFLCQNIYLYAVKKILIHLILLQSVFYLFIKPLNFFQPPHPQFYFFQGILQFLIGSHILPKNVNVHFLLIQHIGIDKVFNIINRPKCHRLGNQSEKFIFQPAETVFYHLPGIFLCSAPGFNPFSVACPELGNGFGYFPLKKQPLL